MVVKVQVTGDYTEACQSDLIMPAETNNGGGVPAPSGVPRASLICRPNSHPFQDRMLGLDQSVKVGRSVARARPVNTNAIFDCKVLSRNHALLWYENGKFYLQDTKSSNGTFVNNQRLSKGSEESPAREVCSGDILQFGVDVMENSRKVTHGCIIATLKLYLPDGKEAKASPSIVNTTSGSSIPAQDLYQLNQYIQESLAREQLLENKILGLQRLLEETEHASQVGWKALMDEDRLLTRVEILESQLTTYGKSMTEDKLREETKRLMEEKENYQNSAKDTLKKIVDDKIEAVNKVKTVEQSLLTLEAEYSSLRQLYDRSTDENKNLSEKLTSLNEDLNKKKKDEVSEMNSINETKNELNDVILKSDLYIETDYHSENGESATEKIESNGKYCEEETDLDKTEHDDLLSASTDSLEDDDDDDRDVTRNRFNVVLSSEPALSISELSDPTKLSQLLEETSRLRGFVEEIDRSKKKTDCELVNLRINLEEAKNENSTVLQELENTRNKLSDAEKLISTQDKLVKDLEEKLQENTFRHSDATNAVSDRVPSGEGGSDCADIKHISDLEQDVNRLTTECKSLRELVQTLQDDNSKLGEDSWRKDQSLRGSPAVSKVAPTGELERSLEEAEEKISGLLQVKEKLVNVQAEKERLEGDVTRLEEELSIIAVASRTLTACTVIPIIVLLVAIVMAFLPWISSIFGTRDF